MTLDQISSISQTIAALAVVASLLFVGAQIRQSERTQRAVMHDNRMRQIRETLLHLASPGVSSSFVKGSVADPDITQTEWTQYFLTMAAGELTRDEQYRQFREGELGHASWQQTQALMAVSVTAPGYRALYPMNRLLLSEEYRALMDSMLEKIGGADPAKRFEAWKALAASERAALVATSPTQATP
jgi:hypothetical protein